MAVPRSTPVPPSFDPAIDGLLNGGGWIGSTIVWGVADNPVEGYFWINGTASAVAINAIIETIDSVIAVDLQYGGWWSSFLNPPLDIAITFTDPETYALLGASPNSDGAVAYPYTPAGDAILAALGFTRLEWPQPEGDVGLNINQQENFSDATPGSFGWFMGLYLGAAALGLKAPQTTGAAGFPTYDSLGLNDLDTPLWTVMASTSTFNGVYPSTLMPGDILALQYLYGADTTTHAGNTTHILSNDGLIRTIYDAGGTDTLDASALGLGAIIDIREVGYSEVGATTIVAIAAGVTIENAIGGAGGDFMTGNDAGNALQGNGGDDDIFGGLGNDIIHGGAGHDILDGWEGADEMFGGDGDDLLLGWEGADDLEGGAGIDELVGEQGADVIQGGDGDDFIHQNLIEASVDAIYGGTSSADSGVDTVDFSAAPGGVIVQLIGYATTSAGALLATLSGIEAAVGTGFNDALIGSAANNRFTGGAGADWIVGRGGDDWFVQGIEAGPIDNLFGGVAGADFGFDTIDYSGAAAGIVVQLNGWSTINGGATLAVFQGIEAAIGSGFNDALIGSAANNRLTGGNGADWLVGGGGDDTFVQGIESGGIDNIFGGVSGADAGFDTIDYSGASAGIVVQLAGWSTINGGATLAVFSGIEAAVGSAFNDALIGNAANNRLTGGAGADWLVGGGGDDTFVQGVVGGGVDTIFGGVSGSDTGFDTIDYSGATLGVIVQLSGYSTINGGAALATFTGIEAAIGTGFNDALIGNASANHLTGGIGADWLVGGGGADRFIYQAINQGGDTINGFSRTDLDQIDLSAIDANAAQAGDQLFSFSTSRTPGLVGEAVATSNSATATTIALYLDSDNVADMVIQVLHQSGLIMNASDFVL